VPIGRLTEDKLESGDFGCSHCNNLEERDRKKRMKVENKWPQQKVAKDRRDSWKYLSKQSQQNLISESPMHKPITYWGDALVAHSTQRPLSL
jgi:hypothetical protein